MSTPQGGIFALGTASHAYLEFDASGGREGRDLVAAVASLREPRTTMGGVNLVAGFRPELWREVAAADAPPGLEGFNDDLVGVDGFTMPATQHDAVLWLSGSAYDVIFNVARTAIAELQGLAAVVEETSSWPYQHDRDLTGFIDGTENPTLIEAPELVLVPEGEPGAGGTILLLQKWVHDAAAWESLPVEDQQRVIGRRKLDSVELEDKPPDSHVASTDQDRFGKIFRRNMPYGTVMDHGTMFVGFSGEQGPLAAMLESMAGLAGGTRDALTRYTRALTGAEMLACPEQDERSPDGRLVSAAGGVSYAGEKAAAALGVADVRSQHGSAVHERVAASDVPGLESIELAIEVLAAALESCLAGHAPERRQRLRRSTDARRAADERRDVLHVLGCGGTLGEILTEGIVEPGERHPRLGPRGRRRPSLLLRSPAGPWRRRSLRRARTRRRDRCAGAHPHRAARTGDRPRG